MIGTPESGVPIDTEAGSSVLISYNTPYHFLWYIEII